MLIIRWIINALALLLVAQVIPGTHIDSFYVALIAALLLGLANAVIRPVLILLTLPVTILTLGAFTLVINALMLFLVASIVKGFAIDTFAAAFWGALILWLISWLTNSLFSSTRAIQE